MKIRFLRIIIDSFETETLLRFFSMSPSAHPKEYRNTEANKDTISATARAENPVHNPTNPPSKTQN